MDIFPSCLAPTGEQFENDLNKLLPHFPTMQVDIADNILVTGQTLTTFEALQKLASNPHSADHTFDFHLMVRDFMPDLRLIQDADSRLHIRFALLHHAADPAPDLFTKQSHRFGLGLVINPDETVDTIIDSIDEKTVDYMFEYGNYEETNSQFVEDLVVFKKLVITELYNRINNK